MLVGMLDDVCSPPSVVTPRQEDQRPGGVQQPRSLQQHQGGGRRIPLLHVDDGSGNGACSVAASFPFTPSSISLMALSPEPCRPDLPRIVLGLRAVTSLQDPGGSSRASMRVATLVLPPHVTPAAWSSASLIDEGAPWLLCYVSSVNAAAKEAYHSIEPSKKIIGDSLARLLEAKEGTALLRALADVAASVAAPHGYVSSGAQTTVTIDTSSMIGMRAESQHGLRPLPGEGEGRNA